MEGARDTSNDIGLMVITPDDAGPYNIDTVAVHGLNGKRWSTWKGGNIMWLRDLLPHDMPSARIMTFGYNADVFHNLSTLGIREQAHKLLGLLRNRRGADLAQRPIVFLCHSLGGIVVKQALILANQESINRSIAEATKGVVFLGTPHRGSEFANYGDLLAKIARVTFVIKIKSDFLKLLKKESDQLLAISDDFLQIAPKYAFTSFYEEDMLRGVQREVVPRSSAIMGIPGEEPMPLEGNHMEICKFSRADSEQYELVWKAIERVSGQTVLSCSADDLELIAQLSDLNFGRYPITTSPLDGTFTWVSQHSVLQAWSHDPPKEPFLLITGKRGSGKSVLSTSVCPQSTGRTGPCLFLPCDMIQGVINVKQVAVTLIAGLLQLQPAYIRVIYPQTRFKDRSGLMSLSQAEVLDDLVSLLKHLSFKKLTIVLDGLTLLDEIYLTIIEIISDAWPQASDCRLAVVTRSAQNIARASTRFQHLDLDHELSCSNDLEVYVKFKVDRLIQAMPGVARARNTIEESFIQRADGMFHFVDVLYQSVLSLTRKNPSRILKQLATLPESYADAYRQALALVRMEDREWVREVLLWIQYSPRRLSCFELNVAVASLQHVDPSEKWQDDISCDFAGDLHITLGSLIRLHSDCTVVFSHGTVADFFRDCNERVCDETWYSMSSLSANQAMMESCLRLLRYDSFDGPRIIRMIGQDLSLFQDLDLELATFLPTSAEIFPDLVRRIGPGNKAILQDICMFCNDAMQFSGWQTLYWHVFDPSRELLPSALHVAGLLGLEYLVQALLEELQDDVKIRMFQHAESTRERPLLDCCAEGESPAVIQYVVEQGARPNLHYKESRTVLSTAAWYGQIEAIEALVRLGAFIHATDNDGYDALGIVASSGRKKAIDALVKLGATVNPVLGKSPLLAAIEFDRSEVFNHLLLFGADVNHVAADPHLMYDVTEPLVAACAYGRLHFVKRLIEATANIDIKSSSMGSSALHLAASGLDMAIVSVLLDAGANVLSTDTYNSHLPLQAIVLKHVWKSNDNDDRDGSGDDRSTTLMTKAQREIFDILLKQTENALANSSSPLISSSVQLPPITTTSQLHMEVLATVFQANNVNILYHILESHQQNFGACLSDQHLLIAAVQYCGKSSFSITTSDFLSGRMELAYRNNHGFGHELLILAIEHKNQYSAAWLLRTLGSELTTATDDAGRTALHCAIMLLDVGDSHWTVHSCIEILLDGGCNPMICDDAQKNSMTVAIEKANLMTPALLVKLFVNGGRISPSSHEALLMSSPIVGSKMSAAMISGVEPSSLDLSSYAGCPTTISSFITNTVQKRSRPWLDALQSIFEPGIIQEQLHEQLRSLAMENISDTIARDGIDFILRQQTFDPDWNYADGWRPLHLFAKRDNERVVLELLKLGADIDARDADGDTTLDVARLFACRDVVVVLEEHLGKKSVAA